MNCKEIICQECKIKGPHHTYLHKTVPVHQYLHHLTKDIMDRSLVISKRQKSMMDRQMNLVKVREELKSNKEEIVLYTKKEFDPVLKRLDKCLMTKKSKLNYEISRLQGMINKIETNIKFFNYAKSKEMLKEQFL